MLDRIVESLVQIVEVSIVPWDYIESDPLVKQFYKLQIVVKISASRVLVLDWDVKNISKIALQVLAIHV